MRTKVQRWGSSLAIRIPRTFAQEVHLDENVPVDLKVVDGQIIITTAVPSRFTLDELLAQITDDNRPGEEPVGVSVGVEAWQGESSRSLHAMNIQIAEYNPCDRQTIVDLFDDFQDFLVGIDPLGRLRRPPGYAGAELQNTLKEVEDHRGTFLVASDEQCVVGFVAAIILPPLEDVGVKPGTRGRITQLYVHPAYRGQGVGRALMTNAERHLNDRGCAYIKVEVFAPNSNAHQFYCDLGYQDYDIDMIKSADSGEAGSNA